MNDNTRAGKRHEQRGQEDLGDLLVAEDALAGIADTGALRLRVHDNGLDIGGVGLLVNVDMAITCARLDNGNGRVLHAVLDEAGTTTRNEHVDQTGEAHELVGRLTAGVLDALDAVNGQAGTGRRLRKNTRDGEAGALRQAATTQNAGIARLDA